MGTGYGIKINLMACAAAALMLASAPLLAVSGKVLQGGVEEENLRIQKSGKSQAGKADSGLRISRTAAPLKGSAVDATAFAQPENPQSDALKGGLVDTSDFAKAPPKNFDIGAERESREMVLAWEKWHHQLSQAIYTRWQRIARDPGKATIKVTVTRNMHISAQVLGSSGSPEFDSTVLEAIESLDGNPGLTFPSKSERQVVSFDADYIAGSNVHPGYSWVKNDYEHIREDR